MASRALKKFNMGIKVQIIYFMIMQNVLNTKSTHVETKERNNLKNLYLWKLVILLEENIYSTILDSFWNYYNELMDIITLQSQAIIYTNIFGYTNILICKFNKKNFWTI